MGPGSSTGPAAARSRSAPGREQATHAAPVASTTPSRAVTTPPAPLRMLPRGPGSYGARLLTTIGDHGDRTRAVYCRIDAACLLVLDIRAAQSYIAAISYIDMARVELPAMSFPRGKDVLSQAVNEILKSKAD